MKNSDITDMMNFIDRNFVVTDPKGEYHAYIAAIANTKGYKVVQLNLNNMECDRRQNLESIDEK